MPAPSPLAPFIGPLEQIGLPYCITGYLREGGQGKHVRDVRFMLAATIVDMPFIEDQVARLELQAQWLQCQARV